MPPTDPVEREIDFVPTKAPYDPRWLLCGRPHPSKNRIIHTICYEYRHTLDLSAWELRMILQTQPFFLWICVDSCEGSMAEWVLWPWYVYGGDGYLGTDSGGGQSQVRDRTLRKDVKQTFWFKWIFSAEWDYECPTGLVGFLLVSLPLRPAQLRLPFQQIQPTWTPRPRSASWHYERFRPWLWFP